MRSLPAFILALSSSGAYAWEPPDILRLFRDQKKAEAEAETVAKSKAETKKSDKTKASKVQNQSKSPARAVTAMSTALKSGHPVLFLVGDSQRVGSAPDLLTTRLQFPVDQRYSKWSVIFDRPLIVDALEVETCNGTKAFVDGIELFLDFNQRRYFSDGGHRVVKFKLQRAATALTLNFLESSGVCLEAVRLKTKTEWLRPRTLPATGDFVVADGSFGTFDRRQFDPKKKLKLDGVRKSGVWKLEWENPLIVDGLRVWNGNQHPGSAFTASDRVQDLSVKLEGGEALNFKLEDRRGFHTLKIENPRAVRSLEVQSLSQYSKDSESDTELDSSREPVLGEIQILAGGETWIPIVPVSAADLTGPTESVSAKEARNHGYGDIVDRELRSADQKEVWKFRFRSDGTYFARIFVDRARVARAWSTLGTWRIVDVVRKSDEQSEVTGLVLNLTGSKAVTAKDEDSVPCAEECWASGQARFFVQETVEIQRQGKSSFFLRNRTPEDSRSIEFSDLKLRLHSLYD